MKNYRKIFGIAAALLFLSFSAEAQFGKALRKAAQRGAERAVEKQVETQTNKLIQRELEKQFIKIFGEDTENQPVGIDMSKMLKGLGENIPTEDQYQFTGYITMEMVTTNTKGKVQDPMNVRSFLGESSDYSGMEVMEVDGKGSAATMIFDAKNDASILLMDSDGEKSSLAYRLDAATLESITDKAIDEQEEDPEFSFKKTGNTKTIHGYSCEEYQVTSKDGEGFYWMTSASIGGYSSFWGSNSPFLKGKAKDRYAQQFKSMPQGNLIEMNYINKDGSTLEMKVTEINESAPVLYQMSDYPNMMAAMEEQQKEKEK